mmetsp:Transcript_35444/g.93029  ORF Transcript_35444/g.93029 Transcript_35444/m.93029 type:complete len:200 (+) Transcript_35444:1024-1623(+)
MLCRPLTTAGGGVVGPREGDSHFDQNFLCQLDTLVLQHFHTRAYRVGEPFGLEVCQRIVVLDVRICRQHADRGLQQDERYRATIFATSCALDQPGVVGTLLRSLLFRGHRDAFGLQRVRHASPELEVGSQRVDHDEHVLILTRLGNRARRGSGQNTLEGRFCDHHLGLRNRTTAFQAGDGRFALLLAARENQDALDVRL